jgi:hypothetical protein
MRRTAVFVALMCTAGLGGCGNPGGASATCSKLVPLLTVGSPPGPSEAINCCGDSKQYAVTQNSNDIAVAISLQAAATTNAGPITRLRLSVAIVNCEAAGPGDCAPVADQTTPNKAAGEIGQPGFMASQALARVSGRNIRLVLTVTNDQSTPSAFYLNVSDVTPGPPCQSAPL